jgi:hypothetical protein
MADCKHEAGYTNPIETHSLVLVLFIYYLFVIWLFHVFLVSFLTRIDLSIYDLYVLFILIGILSSPLLKSSTCGENKLIFNEL